MTFESSWNLINDQKHVIYTRFWGTWYESVKQIDFPISRRKIPTVPKKKIMWVLFYCLMILAFNVTNYSGTTGPHKNIKCATPLFFPKHYRNDLCKTFPREETSPLHFVNSSDSVVFQSTIMATNNTHKLTRPKNIKLCYSVLICLEFDCN